MKATTLRGQWALYGDVFVTRLAAAFVVWLLVEMATGLVVLLGHGEETLILAGAVALGVLVMGSCILNGFVLTGNFEIGLSMGCTRRRQVLWNAAWELGGMAAGVLLIVALNGLSHLNYQMAYAPRGIRLEADALAMLPLWAYPLMVVLPMMIAWCGAATLNRFGQKGLWVVWVLWMVFCLGVPQLNYTDLPETVLWGALALAGAGLVIWFCWAVRHMLRWTIREL